MSFKPTRVQTSRPCLLATRPRSLANDNRAFFAQRSFLSYVDGSNTERMFFNFETADLYKNRHLDGADEVISRMKAAHEHVGKLSAATQDAFRAKTVRYVNSYLQRMAGREQNHLQPTMSSCPSISSVSKVYNAMGVYTFEADLETYSLILAMCHKLRNRRLAYRVAEDIAALCRTSGRQPLQDQNQARAIAELFNQVLQICKDDASVFYVYDTMQELGLEPNHSGFGALLHACRMTTNFTKAKSIFDHLLACNVVTSSHLSIMVNFCIRVDAIAHALHLIFKVGSNSMIFPNGASLSKLFSSLSRADSHKAFELFRFLRTNNVEMSSANYEHLLSICVASENTEAAREIVQHMLDQGIFIESPSLATERLGSILAAFSDHSLQSMIKQIIPNAHV